MLLGNESDLSARKVGSSIANEKHFIIEHCITSVKLFSQVSVGELDHENNHKGSLRVGFQKHSAKVLVLEKQTNKKPPTSWQGYSLAH